MRLTADSYFAIGHAHVTAGRPAQDYAMTGVDGDSVIAVVSDGCSTGGRTDVGARIVALATIQAARISPTVLGITVGQLAASMTARDALGISNSDLLATCIFACASQEGAFYHVKGDGVVAVKHKSGHIWITRYEWADNTPFYFTYSESDRERFREVHGDFGDAVRLTGTQVFTVSAGPVIVHETGYSLNQGMDGVGRRYLRSDLADIEFLAVFSDGVTQIDNVDWRDAVVELMSFKSTTGEFVKRRSMAALRKWREVGKGPIDDFSMAAIRVENEE